MPRTGRRPRHQRQASVPIPTYLPRVTISTFQVSKLLYINNLGVAWQIVIRARLALAIPKPRKCRRNLAQLIAREYFSPLSGKCAAAGVGDVDHRNASFRIENGHKRNGFRGLENSDGVRPENAKNRPEARRPETDEGADSHVLTEGYGKYV